MKVNGGCHCGEIRYEAEVDPTKVVICHCEDCQTLSGTAFRTVVASKEGTFRLISGKLKSYLKTAESGNQRELTFCPECGTPIYSAPPGEGAKVVALRVGSIHQRDQLVPTDQYWFHSSQRWLDDLRTIHRQDTQPAFDPKNGSFSR
jgi:hypothetical protein